MTSDQSDSDVSSSDIEKAYSGDDDTIYAIKKVIEDTLPRELYISSANLGTSTTMTNFSYRVGKLKPYTSKDEETKDLLVEDSINRKSKRRKTGVRGRPKTVDYGFGKSTTHKLPAEASSLMGKGNTAFVKRDYSAAIRYFLEVIKLSPKSPEPYRTLATAYQEVHDYPKAFGYLMIAAHMSNNDEKLWLDVAALAEQLDKKLEAVYSLEMAIKSSYPSVSLEINEQLSALLISLNQPVKAIKCYTKYLMTPVRDESCLPDDTVFQKIAQTAVDYDVIEDCCDYFEKLIRKYIQKLPLDKLWSPINLYLELLLQIKNYAKIIESIQCYSSNKLSVYFCGNLIDDSRKDPVDNMPEEIFTKYAISLLMMNESERVDFERLCNLDPAVYSDLRISSAFAYYEKRKYTEALHLLLPLQDTPYLITEAKVKLGYCQKNLNDYFSAADTFNVILLEDPSREDARIALADLYQRIGRRQEALKLMETGRIIRERQLSAVVISDLGEKSYSEESSDEDIYCEEGVIISFHRSKQKGKKLSKKKRRSRQYYTSEECANMINLFKRFLLFVSSNALQTLSPQLQTDLIQTAGSIWRLAIDNIMLFPKDSKIKFTDDSSFLCGLSAEEWIDFFLAHIIMLEELGRTDLALRAAKYTLRGNLGKCDPLHSEINVAILALHLKDRNFKEAADCFRFLWIEERDDLVPLFYSVLCPNPTDGSKALSGVNFFRAIHRFSLKKPKFLNLKCLLGHLYALSGSFEEAARSYKNARKVADSSEEIAAVDLFLYSALTQRSMQRTCHKPREYLVEAFAYLFRYLKTVELHVPERQAEAYYNVGRAYHGFGMFGAALIYYKKSIEKDATYYPSIYNSNLISRLHIG